MSSCISAIGTANPPYRTPQNEIFEFMTEAFNLDSANSSRLRQIYQHSDIEHRYSVIPDFAKQPPQNTGFFRHTAIFPGTARRMRLYRNEAPQIAASAIKDCLVQYDTDIYSKITHLITVSCTGMYAPGIDIDLVEILGLNRNTERTCINFMGCYGALNALKTADYICRAQPEARVLVVCVELCTLHFQKENTLDNWVANSLFSDGAAAALIENAASSTRQGHKLTLDTFYSEFLPSGHNEMGWLIGDQGFEMKLSSKIPKFILKHLPEVSEKLLNKAGLTSGSIKNFAVHPGGRKILESAEEALNYCPEGNRYAYEVLRDYGNMSSASILFVLSRFLQDSGIPEGDGILTFAFGPGLTVESTILKRFENA